MLRRFVCVSDEHFLAQKSKVSRVCRMPGLLDSVLCVWPQEYNVYERDINNKDGAWGPCLAAGYPPVQWQFDVCGCLLLPLAQFIATA